MNRPIKFRAWDGEFMRYSHNEKTPGYWGVVLFENPAEHKLMQFTGLTDKNGKEIYEGDVLSVRDTFGSPHPNPICCEKYRGEVFWDYSSWRVRHPEQNRKFSDFVDLDELEVIGNIYENSELIAPKEK